MIGVMGILTFSNWQEFRRPQTLQRFHYIQERNSLLQDHGLELGRLQARTLHKNQLDSASTLSSPTPQAPQTASSEPPIPPRLDPKEKPHHVTWTLLKIGREKRAPEQIRPEFSTLVDQIFESMKREILEIQKNGQAP